MRQSNLLARREFLRFLAASPYVAALGGVTAFFAKSGLAQMLSADSQVIANPAEALSVSDFEEAAHRKVQPAHWAYMASGVDDDATLHANREAYQHLMLRPRRLRDATKVDMHTELFGSVYSSPIFLCPVGGQRSYFPTGELAVAGAAKARGTLLVLSTPTSTPPEDVIKTLGRSVWQQLYAPDSWDVCQRIMDRVENAGVTVLALTVDNNIGRNSESFLRNRPKDLRPCAACHEGVPGTAISERRIYDGINMTGLWIASVKRGKGNSLSREFSRAKMRDSASSTASTESWFQTTAAARQILFPRRSRHCPRWWLK